MNSVMSNDRKVLFVVHAARPNALDVAREAARGLIKNGIKVLVAETDVANLGIDGIEHATNAAGCELVIVFGGDGTILRGVEIAREHNVPVLGVNLGHVGFLAEAEPEEIKTVIEVVVNKAWTVESRTALAITVQPETGDSWTTWALNEVVIERQSNENMANLLVSIDGHPLSQWNCDGLLCATPTGSTAYAFSAGGPVVWPEVEALLVVPVSAHALFNRPIVVSPKSLIEVQVISGPVIVSADGRRNKNVTDGAQVKVVRHPDSVQLARIHQTPFTQRLVAKFELPIHGWRAK
jgi:NAD+ kinase